MLEVLRCYAKSLALFSFLFFSFWLKAQDPIFSQFYLNQNYLNPAFAGHTGDLSVSSNTRLQYLLVPGVVATNTTAVNFGCNEQSRTSRTHRDILGYGLIVYNHTEGEGLLHSFNFSGQISSNIQWVSGKKRGRPNKGMLSGGLQFGIGQKFLDWGRFTFSDQYNPYLRGIQNATFISPQNSSSNVFLDLSAGIKGMIEFSKKRPSFFQYGFSIFHINNPQQTFWNTKVHLKPRYSLFSVFHFSTKGLGIVKSREYVSFGMLADYQQGMQSHSFFLAKEIGKYFTISTGYRRQDFFQVDRHIESLIFQWLITLTDWKFGASYDATLSTLSLNKSGGTFEIGIYYTFNGLNTCKTKNNGCPTKGFKMGHEVPKFSL
jgi:type IX secretion system PorP/SprF family membrane protein